MTEEKLQKATFAGGCFWCMQPFFDRLPGVKSVVVGYTGGKTENPTYEEVSSGMTGHAEAVEIVYDSAQASYEKLLDIFFRNIDPTAVNSQFVDHGTQYRSAVFYQNDEQKQLAQSYKAQLANSGRFDKPIATEIVPATRFYPAEDYHQSYYKKKPFQYQMYHDGSGRDQLLEKMWGKEK